MRHVPFICLLLCFGLHAEKTELQEDEITILLEDPVYTDGVLTSDKGVCVKAPGMKIQARKIEYIRKETAEGLVHKLSAFGDLLVDFNNRIYVGDSVDYDFITQSGYVTNGVTCIDRVFVGGEKLEFHKDKSITMQNLYATTNPNKNSLWSVEAKSATLDKDQVLKTEDITVKAGQTPVFYVPFYKTKFKSDDNSPFRYNVLWESGQGPMVSARARLYSTDALELFGRLDYRIKRGFATAFETVYEKPEEKRSFKTRNFYAYDTFYNDNNPKALASRYRLQGIFDSKSQDGTLETFLSWDRLSDRNMQGDFSFQNFELKTVARTEGWIRKRDELYNASLYVRPRINSYQGFMQELPSVNVRLRPIVLGDTGVIMNNHVHASYLDYVYSDSINNLLKDFRSGRVQVESGVSRPINLSYLTITPTAGINSVFYTNTTNGTPGLQLVGTYGTKASSAWAKNFTSWQHSFTPYVEYTGITAPSMNMGMSPIFSVADGVNRLNQVKFGVANTLSSLFDLGSDPRFALDFYGLSFLGTNIFTTPVPKGVVHTEMNFPRVSVESDCGWNFQENLVDFANIATKWTINRYYAMSLEVRHRSPFYWKKDELDNYILDVTRPIEELRNSTLSDSRNTFLAKMHMQITPQSWCQIENHIGWARQGQPIYNETKVDLFTVIASMWQLKLSYMHTVRTDEFSFGFNMISGK